MLASAAFIPTGVSSEWLGQTDWMDGNELIGCQQFLRIPRKKNTKHFTSEVYILDDGVLMLPWTAHRMDKMLQYMLKREDTRLMRCRDAGEPPCLSFFILFPG